MQVSGIFGVIILLYLIWSLAFYFETWLAYFLYEPSCAHQFFPILWDLHVSHSFYFNTFCIALLSLSRNMLWRSYFRAWSIYLLVMETCFSVYSQCRNSCFMWRVHEFWSWEHETSLNRGHKTWPNSTQSKRHMWKVFVMYDHIWPW